MQTQMIAVDKFVFSPTNPRKITEADTPSLRLLGGTIKALGLQQPIIARKAKGNGGRMEIVAGERRVRAARLAGIEELPVIVRELSDEDVRIVQHVENIQREDVKPVEQGASFKELMALDPKAYTYDTLADKFGIARRTVY